jgi:hypothetical protein
MFQVYVPNILSVPDECFKCFVWMLHIHACCKHMFQVFLGVSYVCLQVFYLDVVYVCNDFQMFFLTFSQVFQTLVSSILSIFFYMLELLHLDVSK